MNKPARSILLFACILLLIPGLLSAQQVFLTILHTNDTHGHLLPFSYPSVVPPGSELAGLKTRADIGGIARRATLVKRLREELGKQGVTVWLMDAGDFSDGTSFSTEYHGEADAAAMNAVGYDVATIGNHELNNPLARLKSLLALFHYSILCANVTVNSTGETLLPASQIREAGPVKIGIFGLTTISARRYPASRDALTIAGEVETSQRMAKALRTKADLVIALSHSGENVDQQIAAAVPGVDIIVGGHSHSRLPVGEFVWRSNELKADNVNGTVIVQAHQWGGELGRLDLLLGKSSSGVWRVERYRASLIPITPDVPEDKTVAAVVDRFWKPISARFGELIGQAAADFIERGDDLAPYNLMADSIRESFGTDIELENMGGVRSPLVKGKITREDLVDMDPFENNIVTFKITGRQLLDVLKSQLPAVSGLRYRVESGSIVEATIAGQPVKNDRIYTGATNSYFAGVALHGMETKDTGKKPVEVLADYIRKKGTVRPVFDGRRVILY